MHNTNLLTEKIHVLWPCEGNFKFLIASFRLISCFCSCSKLRILLSTNYEVMSFLSQIRSEYTALCSVHALQWTLETWQNLGSERECQSNSILNGRFRIRCTTSLARPNSKIHDLNDNMQVNEMSCVNVLSTKEQTKRISFTSHVF